MAVPLEEKDNKEEARVEATASKLVAPFRRYAWVIPVKLPRNRIREFSLRSV